MTNPFKAIRGWMRRKAQEKAERKRAFAIGRKAHDAAEWFGARVKQNTEWVDVFENDSIKIEASTFATQIRIQQDGKWASVATFIWFIDNECTRFNDGCWVQHVEDLHAKYLIAKAKAEKNKWVPAGPCDPCKKAKDN